MQMPVQLREPMTAEQPTARHTILVVDDEPAVLELVKVILSRQGYRVLTANSGPRALDTCGQNSDMIDLVLTDVMMPEMSGFDLVRGIRNQNPDLPVLFMTGGTLTGFVENELTSQCHLLKKPFDSRMLVRAVEGVLGARNGR